MVSRLLITGLLSLGLVFALFGVISPPYPMTFGTITGRLSLAAISLMLFCAIQVLWRSPPEDGDESEKSSSAPAET